jgi:hypothetical protein
VIRPKITGPLLNVTARVCLVFTFFMTVMSSPLAARPVFGAVQKEEEEPESQPLAVVCVASVDQIQNDVFEMFKTAGKPQMINVIKGLLGNIDDFKGMDRKKPFGVMLYIETGLPPTPSPIGFVPVKNINDLMKTVANGPFTLKPVKDKKNRYEVVGRGPSVQILLKNGYAFIGKDEDALDRTFPDPVKLSKSLTGRFDIAMSLNMNSIPKATREVFATFLRASSEAEIQQKDDEPAEAYEARRARGLRDLAFVEGLLLDGENLIIGVDASKNSFAVELVLNARPKSKFAKMLKAIGGERSEFANILSATSPFSASICTKLNTADKKAFSTRMRFFEKQITRGLHRAVERESAKKKKKNASRITFQPGEKLDSPPKKDNKEVPKNIAVSNIFDSLVATGQGGVADLFVQVAGEPPGKLAMVGGLRLVEGRTFATGLAGLLRQIKGLVGDGVEINLNATSYKGVAFHRLTPKNIPRPMRRFFGEDSSFLIGAGSKTAWVAIGGKDALTALRKTMDLRANRTQIGKRKGTTAPFQLAFNMSSWLAAAGDDGGPNPGRKLARDAFSKGGDDIRIEVRTTENGIRMHAKFGVGFIRLVGLGINRQYERNRPKF